MKTIFAVISALGVTLLLASVVLMTTLNDKEIESNIQKHKKIEGVTITSYKHYSKHQEESQESFEFKGQDGLLSYQEISKQIFTTKIALMELEGPLNKDTTPSVVSVTSGDSSAKGVYIDSNKVLTCYHVYDIESDKIVIDGYPATVLAYNEMDDYLIAETLLDVDSYVRDLYSSDTYILQENIVKGDSGLPVFDKEGRLYGIVIGKRSDGNIEVLDTREILKNFFLNHKE